MSYDAIRAEFEDVGIGPLLWQLLVDIAARLSRRYPPDPYNGGQLWSEEDHRDLAVEVAVDRLLAEHQLDYIFTIADGHPPDEREDALARLLAFQVRRVLNHRRTVTVVDRLCTRVKVLVGSGAYAAVRVGDDLAVSRPDHAGAVRSLTDEEIRRAAGLIDGIPRLPSSPNAERESKVYNAADLKDLLGRLLDAFGTIVVADIRRILELTLTAWLPTILRDDEEDFVSVGTPPEVEVERRSMYELIDAVADGLDRVQRLVLIGKSQGISDGDLARRVGRSRPWLADRKAEVLERIERDLMDQLPSVLHDEAMRALLDVVATQQEAES